MSRISRLFAYALAPTAALALVATAAVGANGPRFFADDPIWTEPITQDVDAATRYEPNLLYQSLVNLFGKPGDPEFGGRSRDVNTVDEVPDGQFYVNRAGRLTLTPAMVARAANTGNGPADGPWTIVEAKSDGITPGFTIRDRHNDLWFLKFDPPGWRGMATGAEVIASKLFWAVGYHTVEYYIANLVPSNLVIGNDATIEPAGQAERRMTRGDIDWLLQRADRNQDGSYRVIASKAAPGRPVGRIRFEGTRSDDPNDIVPAEHRRSLRGYLVFAAWLNHVDAKGINSIAVLVTENNRRYIRRYLLDFGSALGSAAVGPREEWQGYEQLVEEPREIGRRIISFGARIPPWRRATFFESPSVGRLPIDHDTWNPDGWQPHVTNSAFRHARPDDKFWAAHKLTFMTDQIIAAAVREGMLNDPEGEQMLARMIGSRRDRILATYLPAVNPIVNPVLDAGRLTFDNAAVSARVAAAPQGYRAEWSAFDNATDTNTSIGITESREPSLEIPVLPDTPGTYVRVNIAATGAPVEAWTRPVSAYFQRTGEGWKLVGFQRVR